MVLTFDEIQEYFDFLCSLSIRGIVFIKEQNCSFSDEYDNFDSLENSNVSHIIGKKDGEPVATGRIIFKKNKVVKLERIAVLEQFRGENIGKQLVEFMINFSLLRQYCTIYIHAQTHLLQYYEKLGFVAEGEIFQEANIDHKKMRYSIR